MIHIVRIDDTTRNGKKVLNDLRRYHKGIEFENPVEKGIIPDGYVTGDEFEKQVNENINSYSKKSGIL
ncbi:MAG: hypothetical protein PHV20_05900 [Bacteroidales bacterium]|nr:hypothetical protein [Bacteroidales bacterium]